MKSVNPEVREAVFKRDRWRCQYCGKAVKQFQSRFGIAAADSATLDHVRPRAHGGTNSVHNLVTSCSACNTAKGSRLLTTVAEWSAPKLGDILQEVRAKMERRDEIIRQHRAGATNSEIAASIGLPHEHVWMVLKEAGLAHSANRTRTHVAGGNLSDPKRADRLLKKF